MSGSGTTPPTASATAQRAPGLRAGWRLLVAGPDRIMVPTLVLSVCGFALHIGLQYLIGIGSAGSRQCSRDYLGGDLGGAFRVPCGPSDQRAQLMLVVAIFVIYAVGHLVAAGIYRAGLDAFDASLPRGPFAGIAWWAVLGTAVILGALMTISTAFLALPVIVVGFFIRYTLLFVLDQGQAPIEAALSSARMVAADFAGELGFVLRSLLLLIAGFLVLGIGLYVAVPVVLLAQVCRFRAANAARGY